MNGCDSGDSDGGGEDGQMQEGKGRKSSLNTTWSLLCVNGLCPNSRISAVPFIIIVGTWRWLRPVECRVITQIVTIDTTTRWGTTQRAPEYLGLGEMGTAGGELSSSNPNLSLGGVQRFLCSP